MNVQHIMSSSRALLFNISGESDLIDAAARTTHPYNTLTNLYTQLYRDVAIYADSTYINDRVIHDHDSKNNS